MLHFTSHAHARSPRSRFLPHLCASFDRRFAIYASLLGIACLILFSHCTHTDPASPHPDPPSTDRQYRFGVFPPGNPIDYLASATRLGITEPRLLLSWDAFEPSRGQFAFEAYDGYLNTFQSAGMKPIVTVKSDSSWGSTAGHHGDMSSPPINMDDYVHFIATVVARYHEQVDHWQIENEISDGKLLADLNMLEPYKFWKGSREEYIDVLKNAYSTIKSTDTNAQVVLQGFANLTFSAINAGNENAYEFLDYIMSQQEHFDVLDFHYYFEPDSIHYIMRILRERMEHYGYEKTMICTEAGDFDIRLFEQHLRSQRGFDVPSIPIVAELMEIPIVQEKVRDLVAKGRVEEQDRISFGFFLSNHPETRPLIEQYQAENLAKRVALALNHNVRSFNWHAMMDRGESSHNWYFTLMGLMDQDGVHKPAYYTYKLLIEKLNEAVDVEEIVPQVFQFLFDKDIDPVCLAWNDDGDRVLDLSARIPGSVEVMDIITKRGVTDSDIDIRVVDSKSLTVGSTPIIFDCRMFDGQ